MIVILIVLGVALVALADDGFRRLNAPGQANIALFEIVCAVVGIGVLVFTYAYAWA